MHRGLPATTFRGQTASLHSRQSGLSLPDRNSRSGEPEPRPGKTAPSCDGETRRRTDATYDRCGFEFVRAHTLLCGAAWDLAVQTDQRNAGSAAESWIWLHPAIAVSRAQIPTTAPGQIARYHPTTAPIRRFAAYPDVRSRCGGPPGKSRTRKVPLQVVRA